MRLDRLLLSTAFCFSAAFFGSFFTSSMDWYASLVKPALTPPSWVFGPVWTLLYFMMAVSFYLLWQKSAHSAMKLFSLQLGLNTIWSPLFFSAKNLFAALVVIIALVFTLLMTIRSASRVSPKSALLLLPYLLWVSFATYLNYSILLLN